MKRRRDDDIEMGDVPSSPSALSSPPSTPPSTLPMKLQPLPPSTLLVSLPSLIIHPPTHSYHSQSLWISLQALRQCLRLPDLSPEIECRAWTALAEISMIVIAGKHEWAEGIEAEVEEATTQGLMIAQKHPTLRSYRPQLTFLAAQLAMGQYNVKFARTLLRKLLPTFLPTDPPHIVYTSHLKYIQHLLEPPTPSSSKMPPRSPAPAAPKDTRTTLTAIQVMQNLALKNDHTQVVLLTRMIRLRLLVAVGIWEQVGDALAEVEETLGLVWASEAEEGMENKVDETPKPRKKSKVQFDDDTPSKLSQPNKREALAIADTNTPQAKAPVDSPHRKSPPPSTPFQPTVPSNGHLVSTSSGVPDRFHTSMVVHALIIGVIVYSYIGKMVESHHRLTMLHELLDKGALTFKVKRTETGSSKSSQPRSLDGDGMDVDGADPEQENPLVIERAACGIVQIQFDPSPLPSSAGNSQPSSSRSSPYASSAANTPPNLNGTRPPPLYLQTTHPKTLLTLAYLVSCIAKPDPVGRNPKRKLFAKEGLVSWEREIRRGLEKYSKSSPGSTAKPEVEEALGTGSGSEDRLLPIPYPLLPWSTPSDVRALDIRMLKIKADLMCELVGVSVMRCEFRAAEETLAHLISHLRTYELWESFSARVTLFYAYLAHAKGGDDTSHISLSTSVPSSSSKLKSKSSPSKTAQHPNKETNLDLALKYYTIAESLALEQGHDWVALAARAGAIGVRIGVFRRRMQKLSEVKRNEQQRKRGKGKGKENEEDDMDVDELAITGEEEEEEDVKDGDNGLEEEREAFQDEWDQIVRDGNRVSDQCRGMAGTMWCIGKIIEGCLNEEITTGKNYLRAAVDRLPNVGDTHLKTLVCALIASYYFHTSDAQALSMLAVSENLAAGMGANKKGKKQDGTSKADALGSALMRRWVGQRSLEVFRRTGDEQAAKEQVRANGLLEEAMKKDGDWGAVML
ncbi:hypothetical protein VKT23_013605 [Stygiomarasmius scandens]|uniref:Uncharacterized protein n=1 Tax=Marasmiellus scandens TaxID=2682957 RepID=A0ABR1J7J0_9AGAR